MTIDKFLGENRLIMDGAMGTYYDLVKKTDVVAEEANLEDAETIKNIHKEYIRAGAGFLRTNTFALNRSFYEDEDKLAQSIRAACRIARAAVSECRNEGIDREVFIGADIGPVVYDIDRPWSEVIKEYKDIIDIFLSEKPDAFVFETQSSMEFVDELTQYIKSVNPQIFILVQFSFDRTGYTKSGLSLKSMAEKMETKKYVDAYGLNCTVSSSHMLQLVKNVHFGGSKYISALPNASYANVIRGKVYYSNNISYYTEMMNEIDGLGIRILGGCCGTTPEYIRSLSLSLKAKPLSGLSRNAGDADSNVSVSGQNNILKKLDKGEKVILVELDPPFDDNADKVIEGAMYLKGKGTDVITLSDSPLGRARMESALLSVRVKQMTGMEVMPHISCRDRNTIAIRGMMLGLSAHDIRNLLIITGDPIGKGENIKQVFEYNSIRFMEYAKVMNEEVFKGREFVYGGALNYNGVNKDAIAKRMRDKMAAGAAFFLTQPVYSDEDIERIIYLKNATKAKIFVGIMPLVSRKNAVFMHNEMPGIHIADSIMEQYKDNLTREEYEQIAVKVSVDIIKKLKDNVDGYYFMTPFNRYKLIQEIIDRIK